MTLGLHGSAELGNLSGTTKFKSITLDCLLARHGLNCVTETLRPADTHLHIRSQ